SALRLVRALFFVAHGADFRGSPCDAQLKERSRPRPIRGAAAAESRRRGERATPQAHPKGVKARGRPYGLGPAGGRRSTRPRPLRVSSRSLPHRNVRPAALPRRRLRARAAVLRLRVQAIATSPARRSSSRATRRLRFPCEGLPLRGRWRSQKPLV